MRLSALLFFLCASVSANTITIATGLTIVLCDNYTIKHYADDVVVIVACPGPPRGTPVKIPCANPKLQVLSPGNFRLTC